MVPWVECGVLDWDIDRVELREPRKLPEAVLAAARRLLDAVQAEIPPRARILAQLARLRTWGRFHREVRALARLADVDWRDLMLANLSYDLVLASIGCSTVALPTRDGPVVARNMDWWPEDLLARASWLIRYFGQEQLQFVAAGWPGGVGVVTGMSRRGFALVLNAVLCPERRFITGYPVLLFLRRVLQEAPSFDAALHRLVRQRLTSPALITLVGTENHQRVVIERTPTRHALRWGRGDEPLLATNHYLCLGSSHSGGREAGEQHVSRAFPHHHAPGEGPEPWQLEQTACSRYDALCQALSGWSASDSARDERLLYLLSDPAVIQDITAQHIIMRPRQQQIRLFVPRRLLAEGG